MKMYILKSNIRTLPTEKVQDVSEYTLHCKLVSFLGIQIAFFFVKVRYIQSRWFYRHFSVEETNFRRKKIIIHIEIYY